MSKTAKIIIIIVVVIVVTNLLAFGVLYKNAKNEAKLMGMNDQQYVLYKNALNAGKSMEEAKEIALGK